MGVVSTDKQTGFTHGHESCEKSEVEEGQADDGEAEGRGNYDRLGENLAEDQDLGRGGHLEEVS